MGRFLKVFVISLVVLVSSCKKKNETSTTDNLFKFKDYISYHTNGQQSIAAPIKIVLAKQLDQFDLTQELPVEYIKVEPKIEGKLTIENGRELTFQPHISKFKY